LPDRGEFGLVEREEMLDFERRQRSGKPVLAEVSMLPSADRGLFLRAG
jgi:hypothetical protein